MKSFIIFMVMTTLWTSLCHAQSLLLSETVSLNPVPAISPQDVNADLETFISYLNKGYGGKGILPKGQFEGLITGLRALSANSVEMSSENLCNEIGKLTEQVNDFHLTVHIGDKTCQRSWPKASVGPNSGYGQKNTTWSLTVKPFNNQMIPILAIQKMSPAASSDWNGFLETVKVLKAMGKPFIIDLRGNPGGDSTKGKQAAAILYGVQNVDQVPMPKKVIYRLRSPEAWAAMINFTWLQMQSLSENKRVIPDYTKANYQSMVEYYNKSIQNLMPPVDLEDLGNENLDLTNAQQSPVYVLIDKGCGSSCELTVEALEKLPSAHTIGENTTGVVQYGNVGSVYLSKSHIVIRLPTQGAVYADQRQIEKNGYAPKVRVTPGTDALEYTLNNFFN